MRREDAFNELLGTAIRSTNPMWINSVIVEETQKISESNGMRIDVLIADNTMPPVAIETSYLKGNADMDAKARLGKHYKNTMEEIKTAIAIELDSKYRKVTKLNEKHLLKYALYQKILDNEVRRFPDEGFMFGSYKDIARLAASTAISKEDLERVAKDVGNLVHAAANKLDNIISDERLLKISKIMYQRSSLTGLNTTAILWLNAFLVQQMLQSSEHEIPSLTNVPSDCVNAWKKIININWRAIFEPAISILDDVRKDAPLVVSESLELLQNAVEKINLMKLGNEINIGAELFPIVADDRKESAAFYTQAHIAEFLVTLTISENMVPNWSDPKLFHSFRIADLACGTGTLIRFGYRQVKLFHEQNGGTRNSIEKLHQNAMENGLFGMDVSPIAAHLTSTSLALGSKEPYGNTNIGWVGVGMIDEDIAKKYAGKKKTRNVRKTATERARQKHEIDACKVGSIEYLKANSVTDMLSMGFGASTGQEKNVEYSSIRVDDGSIDVILMNPPYSRTRGGQSAFDIAGLNDTERIQCQTKWANLIKNEACDKRAGMAATFLCISEKKVKPGGRIGFVLPRTAAFADTWEKTRNMIEYNFEDISAIVVASGKALGKDAFSADTKMEEMFLIATKKNTHTSRKNSSSVRCVVLHKPITRLGEAAELAKVISIGKSEGPILLGNSEIGTSHLFQTDEGRPWSSLGVIHEGSNEIMLGLLQGKILDVEGLEIVNIPMTTIGELFDVGPSHDSIGHLQDKDPRGAFTFNSVMSDTDTIGKYRSMWNADNNTQTSMLLLPTHKGTKYREQKCMRIWNTRSRLFYARGMRWTSQKIVAAMTDKPVMGGRAWTSLSHQDPKICKAFALWSNSIYGMITYWARGGRTQSGRSTLQINAIKKVPCPKFDRFEKNILNKAAMRFDDLSNNTLNISNLADNDVVRDKISKATSTMFKIPDYDTVSLTKLWCGEPSVNPRK